MNLANDSQSCAISVTIVSTDLLKGVEIWGLIMELLWTTDMRRFGSEMRHWFRGRLGESQSLIVRLGQDMAQDVKTDYWKCALLVKLSTRTILKSTFSYFSYIFPTFCHLSWNFSFLSREWLLGKRRKDLEKIGKKMEKAFLKIVLAMNEQGIDH